eukprot:symbB.v1.2.042255.t1/scaffold9597.1/size2787/1
MERSFNEDGNGRDPEFTLPLIHVDEIFMSKLGEDEKSMNFSVIISVPERRALYLYNMIHDAKKHKSKLEHAMGNSAATRTVA